VDVSQGEISKTIPSGSFADWNRSAPEEAAANHATDFTRPIYNVWKWQEKTDGAKQQRRQARGRRRCVIAAGSSDYLAMR
jgi:hypothetical protein